MDESGLPLSVRLQLQRLAPLPHLLSRIDSGAGRVALLLLSKADVVQGMRSRV